MMLDSPHTSVPMLMRGNTPPTTRSPPHRSRPTARKPTQPTTRHSRRGRTGRERPDVEEDVDEGTAPDCRPLSLHRQCGMRTPPGVFRPRCIRTPPGVFWCSAGALATPHSNKTQSTGSCAPARGRGPEQVQDCCPSTHCRLRAPPGPLPRRRPPCLRSPTRHVPRQQQQA